MLQLTWNNPAALTSENPDEGLFVESGFVDETVTGDVVIPYFRVRIPNPGINNFFSAANTERTATLKWRLTDSDAWKTLAKGRMTAMPADVGGDLIEIEFTCVPEDEDEVLKAAADALRIGELPTETPYDPDSPAPGTEEYDPLFYSRDATDDPTNALAARPERWRWDRATNSLQRIHFTESGSELATSLTSSFGGGTTHNVDLTGFVDSLQVRPLEPPRATTRLRLVAPFTQSAKGKQTFNVDATGMEIKSYSYDDLVATWPQPGTAVGVNTGWTIAESEIQSVTPDLIFDAFNVDSSYVNGDPDVTLVQLLLAAATVRGNIRLAYDYTQQREEILTIDMAAGIQSVLGDDRKETIDVITLAALNLDHETPEWLLEDPDTLDPISYDVGDQVQANGSVWKCIQTPEPSDNFQIGKPGGPPTFAFEYWWEKQPKRCAKPDAKSPRYFDTDRGRRSIRHALRRLKRTVLERAQSVQISFECSWEQAVVMSTKDRCRVEHRLLSAGQAFAGGTGTATGKITSVRLIAGTDGMKGSVTMLCAVGTGGGSGAGDEHTDDIAYTLTAPAPKIPVNAAALATRFPSVRVYNDYSEQKMAASGESDPVSIIQAMPTRIEISVVPIQEEDLLTRRMKILTAPLPVPKDIDL